MITLLSLLMSVFAQNIALFRCQFHVLLEKLRGKGSLLFWALNSTFDVKGNEFKEIEYTYKSVWLLLTLK